MTTPIDLDHYQTVTSAAQRTGKGERWIRTLCQQGRVPGAHLFDGTIWMVPTTWAPTAPVGRPPRAPIEPEAAPTRIAAQDIAKIL